MVVVACALVAVGTLATSSSARGWVGDRASEFRGEGGDAVANDPGRLVNTSGNQRRAWWGEAWRGFEASPVIGEGAGGFPLVHLEERRAGDNALNTREAHGVVLSMLSGLGIVGLALLAALLAAIVWGVLRATDIRRDPDIGLPLAVLAAFILQAAVDWSWSIPALTVPTLAAAGVVLATAAPGRIVPRPRPSALAAGALGAAVAVAMISATLPWWSGHLAARGEDALADGRPRAAIDDARAAHSANPLSIGPILLLGQAYDDLGDRRRALGALEEATRVQPDNPAAWRALAIYIGGRGPASAAAWREVHRLDPQDPEAALRAG